MGGFFVPYCPTPKSQSVFRRVEANIFPKHGPGRKLINHTKKCIVPKMVGNQNSFEGKGCNYAIINALDEMISMLFEY